MKRIIILIVVILLSFSNGFARIDPNLPEWGGNDQDAGFKRPGDSSDPVIYVVNTLDFDAPASSSTRPVEGGGTWPVRQGGELTLMQEHETSGKKGIMILEVSGYIEPDSPYFFRFNGNNSGWSYLGGTAPIPGVIHRGVTIRTFNGSDTVKNLKNGYWSHFRSYLAEPCPPGMESSWRAFSSASALQLFDHCEWLYGTDINWGAGNEANMAPGEGQVMIWRSIAAWGLNNTQHPTTPDHSKGLSFDRYTYEMAVIESLMAHNEDRNPYLQIGTKSVINCVTYNYGIRPIFITYTGGVIDANIVGNVVIAGPSTAGAVNDIAIFLDAMSSSSRMYFVDNRQIHGASTTVQSDYSDWSIVQNNSGVSQETLMESSYITGAGPTYSAADSSTVEATVLANAGAYPAYRTSTITTLINQVTNRSGAILDAGQESYPSEWSDYQQVTLPANPHNDYGDGYTNIEHWYWDRKALIEGTGGSDTTPPDISVFSPTGTLLSTTTQTTVSVQTNEAATCQWNETGGLAFDDPGQTEFTNTGGTQHSFTYTGLNPFDEISIYIRCEDAYSNANTSDYIGSFNIGPPANLLNDETYSADSGNYNVNSTVEGIWDGCVDSLATCTAGNSGVTQLWAEFDLQAPYDLTKASVFGDALGVWLSNTWTMKYKLAAEDAWTEAFSTQACAGSQWYHQTLAIEARYLRFEVNGPSEGTRAREIHLQGTLADSGIPVGLGQLKFGGTGSGDIQHGGDGSAIMK